MFSERITKLRKERGLTQKDFAEKLGVSIDSVRRWEQGKRSPDVEMLSNITRVLNTTVSYISGETDNPDRAQDDGNGTLPHAIKEKIDNDMSFIKRGDFIGNGKVLFYHGDDLAGMHVLYDDTGILRTGLTFTELICVFFVVLDYLILAYLLDI